MINLLITTNEKVLFWGRPLSRWLSRRRAVILLSRRRRENCG